MSGKMKPKFIFRTNKKKRLSVMIPEKTYELLSDYQDFHKNYSGEEINLDRLVAGILSDGLTKDKVFLNWKSDKAKQVESGKINKPELESKI